MTSDTVDRDDWFVTHSGRVFFVRDPDPSAICIEDVAHALAHVCRFGGHCDTHYSVAQHSIFVSHEVTPHLALHALLHDAAEAYIGDVIRPLKHQLPEYKAIEVRVEAAIAEAFGLRPLIAIEREAIKAADRVALATERRDVHPLAESMSRKVRWVEDELRVKPSPRKIVPMSAMGAGDAFRSRFADLLPGGAS